MRVRIAVDRLHEPDAVIDVGAAWAARLGATVDLLFVHPAEPTPEEVADHALLLKRVPAALRGVALVKRGRPADQIVTDLEGCDVLMLGTHGWRGLAHLVLGSVAERVVRTCPVPVLVLRTAPAKGPIRALVALDASRPAAAETLDLALPWLQQLGARVDLVHVEALADTTPVWMDPATMDVSVQTVVFEALARQRERDKATLARHLAHLPESMRGIAHFTDGEPSQRVADVAENYDLTVLATHGRAGFDRLWLGSVTENALRHVAKTVLVLRHPEAAAGAPT